LIDNELRNGRLAADGVNRDQATRQVERPQQFGDGGDFVRLVSHLSLPQDEVIGRSPGVVRRNAVGQIEKRGKPGPFAAAKLGYGDPVIGPPDDGSDGDHQDRHLVVRFRALKSGIPQVGKMGRDTDTGLCPDKWMQTHSRTSNGS
jgi:hypothetical protein